MNPITYNVALIVGTGLIGAGVGMVSVPAALVTVGGLIIGLTVFGAYMARRKA